MLKPLDHVPNVLEIHLAILSCLISGGVHTITKGVDVRRPEVQTTSPGVTKSSRFRARGFRHGFNQRHIEGGAHRDGLRERSVIP